MKVSKVKKGKYNVHVKGVAKKKQTGSKLKSADEDIIKLIDSYEFLSSKMPITIKIFRQRGEFVPIYDVSISSISKNTELILEKIRQRLITEVNLGMVDLIDPKNTGKVEDKFKVTIEVLVEKYFPDADERTVNFLTTYLTQRCLGMGNIEILSDDDLLEEIAINSSDEPAWVYHRKHGWLKTNVMLTDEDQTKHYSMMIARKVGRQITMLNPLMDANLSTGDRVNATLMPISNHGNTITLRKFASKAWTITDFVKAGTIAPKAATLIWESVQYELSALIAGGTATGKTSMLNVVANFFPPNQRIISIEDTREIRLPKFLHWLPMLTRQPNPEGKGEVSMLDLLVNSLRQRPDRIIVGEIRRKVEAEVLFEAIHTGHSVYATVHANDTNETITRLTGPPIEVPKAMLPAISMIIVQHRNRRTGVRKTFQLSEIREDGDAKVLLQHDLTRDKINTLNKSVSLFKTLELFAGLSKREIQKHLYEKEKIIHWLVKQNINDVNDVGRVMAEYYTNIDGLMKVVRQNKKFGDLK